MSRPVTKRPRKKRLKADPVAPSAGASQDSTVNATGPAEGANARGTRSASIFPTGAPLAEGLANAVDALEKSLGMPVWLLMQNGGTRPIDIMNDEVWEAFRRAKGDFKQGQRVALVLDSPGGQANVAYHLGRFLQRRCGGFTAVVPAYAKSAATLLCLGADEILLAPDAELGPLDAQYVDQDREKYSSALDEVQALERLNATALEAVDQTMLLLLLRTRRRTDFVLPHTLKFVAEMMRPLLEKIDAVQFTQRSRTLKVAEEYATRLLVPGFSRPDAEKIARRLVETFPEHGFVIDSGEAAKLGLKLRQPTLEQEAYLDVMAQHSRAITVLGRLVTP